MADVTVTEFAQVLKVPVERLLTQLDEAGIKVSGAEDTISEDAKLELLTHLRRSHGRKDPGAAAPRKITLKRKSQSELRLSSGQGRSRTVSVEVRRKRTYVKRDVLEEQARKQQEELDAKRREEEEREAELRRQEEEKQAEEQRRLQAAAEKDAAEEQERVAQEQAQQREADEEARRAAEEEARRQAEEAEKARAGARSVFGGGGDKEHVPSTDIAADQLAAGVSLIDLLALCGLSQSKSEARRLIKAGGPTKADLRLIDVGDGPMVVKDFSRKAWWVRAIGRLQVSRETRAYEWLGPLEGVVRLIGRVDRHALVLADEVVAGDLGGEADLVAVHDRGRILSDQPVDMGAAALDIAPADQAVVGF